jgi:DNA-binding response OmpR family regulator
MEATQSRQTQSPHVLLVERDDALRERCRAYLTQAGYRVATARDGAEALQRVARQTPQGIVLSEAGERDADRVFLQRILRDCPQTAIVLRRSRDGLWRDFAAWSADGCVSPQAGITEIGQALTAALRTKRARESEGLGAAPARARRKSLLTIVDHAA